MHSIEIRKATSEDVSLICSIQTECSLSPWPRSAYEAEVTRKDAIILVAANESGDSVGFITGRIIAGGKGSLAQAEIYNLGVSQGSRLLGFGSALVEQFIDRCRVCGVKKVFLEVRKSNLAAIKFYGTQGFTKRGERKNFYTDPVENAEIMGKNLSDPGES